MNATQYVDRLRNRQIAEATPAFDASVETPVVTSQCSPVPIEDVTPLRPAEIRTLGLIELVLKNRPRLHRLLRVESAHVELLPRLLAIAIVGFLLFGITMSLVLTVSGRWPALQSIAAWLDGPTMRPFSFDTINSTAGNLTPWINGQAFVLTGAYAFGLVAASGVALPSLYFYCLLAGVRMSMLEVVVHAVKAKAIASVVLIGILPIYVAAAMGVVIFNVGEGWLQLMMILGLFLPFIAGLWGTASLYQGFAGHCDTMPADRMARRVFLAAARTFLVRLLFSDHARDDLLAVGGVLPRMIGR